MPATYDLSIWRGNNNPPIILRFRNEDESLFDLSGSRLILTITHRGQMLLQKDTSTDATFLIDVIEATLTWAITTAEARLVPLGRIARYEIERWISGTQRTLLEGRLIGEGGDNIDV